MVGASIGTEGGQISGLFGTAEERFMRCVCWLAYCCGGGEKREKKVRDKASLYLKILEEAGE